MEEDGILYIIEDNFNQATGIYYKKVPEYGNVVESETAVDILTVRITFLTTNHDK